MTSIFKKSLACCLAVVLCLTCMLGALTVSAAEVKEGTFTVENATVTPGTATADVEITIDAEAANVIIMQVETEAGEVTAVEAADAEGAAMQAVLDAKSKKIYVSNGDGNIAPFDSVVVTVTVALADIETEKEYDVVAKLISAASNVEDEFVIADATGKIIVKAAEPEVPECKHEHLAYVSHVAPIQGGANGSITYTCTDCGLTETKEVLYDNTFKFDYAFASYQAETVLTFTFSTTATNWTGVDQTKSFAILTKDNNSDKGGEAEVLVEYLSDLTENGTITTNIAMNFPLAATELNDNVARQIIVYKDGKWYSRKVGNYSFVTYASGNLVDASVEASEKVLIMDLLNYGTIAQARFSYNTANPANTADPVFANYSGSTNEITLVDNLRTDNRRDRYRFNGVAASFESRAEMNFLITDTTSARNPISDTSLVYVEVAYTDADGENQVKVITGDEFRVAADGSVYADFAELYSTQMRQEVTVTLKAADDDSVQYIAYYSLEYYAASATGNDVAITEACIRFGDSANAHFNK